MITMLVNSVKNYTFVDLFFQSIFDVLYEIIIFNKINAKEFYYRSYIKHRITLYSNYMAVVFASENMMKLKIG